MNILIVISSINNSGGTERVASMLANSLSESCHTVTIASIAKGDEPFFKLNNEIRLVSLLSFQNNKLFRITNSILKLRRLLKDHFIDAVIVVDTLCIQFTLPAVAGLKVKHICWEQFNFNNRLGPKKRELARYLAARYCDAVVTLTHQDRLAWLENTSSKAKIVTIANSSPFDPQDSFTEKNNVVLAIGNLTYIKGFDLLLSAWVKVNQSFPEWKLKIVGEGEDRRKLTDFIFNNNLQGSVELVGRSNDVASYYKEADIFCLSSRSEGFGMVLIEALSFGLPVVSFDCEFGPAEILEGTGSILVPPNDTDLLACSLIKLIKDEGERAKISKKSIEKSKTYSRKNISEQWAELINDLN